MGEAPGDRKRNVIDARVLEAFRNANATPAALAQLQARMKPEDEGERRIVVEPENADAVRLFRQMQSQWRVQAVATAKRLIVLRTGLDYGALAPIAAALRVELGEETMDALRLLEAETLAIHNRRQEQLLRS
jgi:hypothetical protein